MRFIHGHECTKEALRIWAGDMRIVNAPFFFFWNSGTELQMSHEGLLRSLLYQILSQIPDLTPTAFADRVELGMVLGQSFVTRDPLTLEELMRSFRTILSKATRTHKLVFFIDGMDEFQVNPADIVSFIKGLVAPNVKTCASSRPWVVFQDNFGCTSCLRLEDLTYDDIVQYVSANFQANTALEALRATKPRLFDQFDQRYQR